MSYARDLKIIFGNLRSLFIMVGVIMLAMAAVCMLADEPDVAPSFFYGGALGFGIGTILKLVLPENYDPELRHAMIVAALAYLVVPAISMVPFLVTQHMSPLDAFFESISGWTGTGYSMIVHPESADRMILLWRSLMQWIGGLGVIVLMATILIRPGTSTFMLYQSEARKDKIHPSIRSTLNTIWGLYVVLTIASLVLLLAVGLPMWDAANLAMSAIGTGGFSIYGASIAAYHSVWAELVIIPIMLVGALPFITIYRAVRKSPGNLIGDMQVRTICLLIAAGGAILTVENLYLYPDVLSSARYSFFQFTSAITSAGFQTTDVAAWSPSALLIISLAMTIGGCAGSTAGGIKIARAIFMGREARMWLRTTLLPPKSIATIKIGGKRVTEDIVDKELAEATLISVLWAAAVFVSVVILSHQVGSAYDLSQVIFTVCASLGNAGINCGIVDPGLNYLSKVVLILDMWIGRLEIIPVMLLVRFMFKGFKI
jgi:trk system potassium uptake protein TrkH